MENNWKDFLYFSKPERNGIFVLLLLSLLLFITPHFISFAPEETIDFSDFEKEVNAFLSETKKQKEVPVKKQADSLFQFDPNTLAPEKLQLLGLPDRVVNNIVNYRKKGGRFFRKEDLQKIYGMHRQDFQRLLPYINITQNNSSQKQEKSKTVSLPIPLSPPPVLQPFNPNTASKNQLIALGLSPKAAQTLLNFRQKGGTFRKKEDLKKVFGISAADYQTLEPFIQLEQSTPKPKEKKKPLAVSVDINKATAEDFQKLKGIGPVYARRIVNWREKLGGFYSIQQLGTTYGLPDSTFQSIKPFLQVSPVHKTLAINLASVEDLQKHPYINYRQAKAIVNYRNNHGKFTQWEELKKLNALSEKTIKQIKPYLAFE